MRKEFRNPGTGVERVSLADVLSGAIGFALLQRWEKQRTEQEWDNDGVTEIIWDVVVVDGEDTALEEEDRMLEDIESNIGQKDDHPDDRPRPLSWMSIDGEDGFDDAASMVSTTSLRQQNSALGTQRPEQTFRQHLMNQLKPGSSVKVTAQSRMQTLVTVEVTGDDAQNVEPPQGFSFVAAQQQDSSEGKQTQKLVFRNRRKRTRTGSFDVEQDATPSTPAIELELQVPSSDSPLDLTNNEPGPVVLSSSNKIPADNVSELRRTASTGSVRANQKRPRSSTNRSEVPQPEHFHSRLPIQQKRPQPEKESARGASPDKRGSLRKTILRGTGQIQNLVEFWNGQNLRRKANAPVANPNEAARARTIPYESTATAPSSPGLTRNPSFSRSTNSHHSFELRRSLEAEPRPSLQSNPISRHKRNSSSICTVHSMTSETSLVLHSAVENSILTDLSRHGRLFGQYPQAPFADNVARFARFSVAAYGSQFLRLTGAIHPTRSSSRTQQPKDESKAVVPSSDLVEHNSFTSYTLTSPSTVLLSSHVDPIGVASITSDGQNERHGLPLVHFLTLDHETKSVVLTLRGTLGFEDILTDMTCDYSEMTLPWQPGKTYQVHRGIFCSARRLLTLRDGRLLATTKAALEEFADYGFVICGHSLGGGVASLVAMMLGCPNASFTTEPSADSPSPFTLSHTSAYVTGSESIEGFALPPNRPIHVYAYGPPATLSPALQRATRGLISTIIHGVDIVPYLSLGALRDCQSVALAFKSDDLNGRSGGGAKGRVRQRVWDGIKSAFAGTSGVEQSFNSMKFSGDYDAEFDDEWTHDALQSLREGMTAEKLVPPGEVFVLRRHGVLRRHAFLSKTGTARDEQAADGLKMLPSVADASARAAGGYKAASHVTLTHIKDVGRFFSEIPFSSGGRGIGDKFADHVPKRYERACEALGKGVGFHGLAC